MIIPLSATRRTAVVVACLATAFIAGYELRSFREDPGSAKPAENAGSPGSRDSEVLPSSVDMAAAERHPVSLSWSALQKQPLSARLAGELAARVAQLAKSDPESAMKMALGETNGNVRAQLRDAVLKAWAENEPEKAAAWALHQPPGSDRLAGMAAVFEGAAAQSSACALQLVEKLYAESPDLAADYGSIAINALAKVGAFREAVQFAAQARGNPSQLGWVNTAFDAWSAYQPEAAASALSRLTTPELHREAFLGVVSGWSSVDAAGLANYAKTLALGEDRTDAMRAALLRWVNTDPVGASEWLSATEPGPDTDQAAAAVATVPSLIYCHPDTALSWATSIADPEIRATTLRTLAGSLSLADISAARRLVSSAVFANDADRAAFSAGVHAPPSFAD